MLLAVTVVSVYKDCVYKVQNISDIYLHRVVILSNI